MKRSFWFTFSLVLMTLICMGAGSIYNGSSQPVVLQSTASPYYLLRAEANENNSITGIDLTTAGDFGSKPDVKDLMKDTLMPNAVQFAFAGGGAADKTLSWTIYAWRNKNGMAELLATGTATLGTQAVVKYPDADVNAPNRFWADTLVISSQGMPKAFQVVDAGGDNRVAKLYGDVCGYRYLYCVIDDANDGDGEANNVSVYYSTF